MAVLSPASIVSVTIDNNEVTVAKDPVSEVILESLNCVATAVESEPPGV